MRVWASHETHAPVLRSLFLSDSHTRKHHCFRPLRACSLPSRTSKVTSLRAQDMEETPRMSPLTLDYVTCTSLAATSRLNNTNTSPHHVVNKHHTIIMQERPLDMSCFSRAHLLPFRHTTYNNQAQAPRKSVMQARCTLSRVPRTRRRHLISQLGELRVSPHL